MDAAFWSGRRVLITGHTGFKGSWLALWLSRLGADVAGFALAPPTEPSLFTSARVADGIVDLRGDVRDLTRLRVALAEHEPEVIFHLAAQPLVRLSYAQPVDTFATNVMGTVNLLEAARHAESVRSIVLVTSDKCYENKEWVWGYREHEAMGGHDPYSASKGCAELAAVAYRRSFFSAHDCQTGVATVRAGNVIGGGDWAADRLLPDAVRALSAGRTVIARRPNSVRPWQHVLEPLRGYIMLAQRLLEEPHEWSGGWNFGPRDDDAIAVGELLELFVRHWGSGRWQPEPGLSGPHEARLLRLDSSKAREQLGWRPSLELTEAVRLTAEWYRHAAAGATDLRELTCQQIDHYEAKATGAPAPRIWLRPVVAQSTAA
jgi:CDP-glucose 4,6-dehydratase